MTSVGHSVPAANTSARRVLPQSVKLAIGTGRGGKEEAIRRMIFTGSAMQNTEQRSGSHLLNEPVKSQPQPAQEKQRQKIIGHRRHNLNGNAQRRAVSSREVINYRRQQHAQQPAPRLLASLGPASAARQLHLRHRFAAKRALRQLHADSLAAIRALPRLRWLPSESTHTGTGLPLSRLGSRPWHRQGMCGPRVRGFLNSLAPHVPPRLPISKSSRKIFACGFCYDRAYSCLFTNTLVRAHA